MDIRELSEEEMREVYQQHMVNDFPSAELRSLNNLLRLHKQGEYNCLGMYDEAELKGYAFFIRHEDDLIIDYYAIAEGNRDRGLGSLFMRYIQVYYEGVNSLIAEIDDPDHSRDEEERALRLWRKSFYERNGFRMTGAVVKTFGVWFQLIECGKNTHTAEEAKAIYAKHYRRILPPKVFKKHVKLG